MLELARGSPFEGERANALAAAHRLAEKHGLSLEEAARGAEPPPAPPDDGFARAHRFNASAIHLDDILAAKRRRNEALNKARERGLDEEVRKQTAKRAENAKSRHRASRARRAPEKYAAVLLRETSLPFHEIAEITGLNIYLVVGLKLKMRQAA